ncbi:MAG: adenylosuccinate synthetase, partial [Lachnospiraceae bacterium]|nr:adenylosuccinate synthetase [Lachnospiraceae bacterium]
GISGTSVKNREEFNKLMCLCKRGRVDMIITKSISRFARNTVDCLRYTRMLHEHNVDVFFEEQGIHSTQVGSEFYITIFGSLAQSESENISANVIWGKQQSAKAGNVPFQYKNFLGYRKGEDGKPEIDPEELLKTLHEYKEMVAPYVCDVSAFLDRALKDGKTVLLEGQLGTLKDPDHGIYPMVTSSSTLAAYGAVGAGIPPYEIKQVVTVCKAYSSAVGAGAFVSEIFGDDADELRRRGGDGGEYGATTGRPRRMGWFDCVASKYGCRLQGTTDVAFTVLDVLGYLDEIPVCVGYEIDGKVTTDFPVTHLLEKAKPVLRTLPGWKCDIRGIDKYEDLPENCRNYIEFIEKQIGYPITMISNGPRRQDIIYRESPLKKA